MKHLLGWVCFSFFTNAFADTNSERMSARDLYYKLLQESTNVKISEQEEAKQKQIEAWKKMDRRHKLQRVGPDPRPDLDRTLQIPSDPNPLNPPYGHSEDPKTDHTPTNDDKKSGIIEGPPDEPKDNPDRDYNIPSAPLSAPENPGIKNNPLLQTDQQKHYLEDKTQPLKTPEERSKDINPQQIKNNPLNDQTD